MTRFARAYFVAPLLLIALTSACAPQASTPPSPALSQSGQPSPTPSPITASAIASASASPAIHSNATLGYRVGVPAGYRPSSCGPWINLGTDLMGTDFFTRLSDREERELNVGDIPPRERASDFGVFAYRNTDGKSAVEWARAQPGNRDSTVSAITVGGREAARIVGTDRIRAVSFAVRGDSRIYSVASNIRQEGVDTEPLLSAVAASLEPITPGPFPTPSTRAPRDEAQEVATALARAFSQRDAAGVSLQTHGCLIGMHAVIDPPQPDSRCCILNRSISSFVEALRPALAAGTVTLAIDPAVKAASEGGRERFFVVSRWTEEGKTRQIDLFIDPIGGQWRWSGAVHHFSPGPICYGRIWGGTSC